MPMPGCVVDATMIQDTYGGRWDQGGGASYFSFLKLKKSAEMADARSRIKQRISFIIHPINLNRHAKNSK